MQHDRHHQDIQYNVGDQVFVHTHNLPLHQSKCKLAPRWVGPFSVCARRGPNAYTLANLPNWLANVHPTFNVSQLKPAGAPEASLSPTPDQPQQRYALRQPSRRPAHSPPLAEEEDDEYEIDKILCQCGRKFLVRWKNYGQEHDQWLHEDDLTHAQDLLHTWTQC